MNIEIKQVTFKSIDEVAYGTHLAYFVDPPQKNVTVYFTVDERALKLEGYLELPQDEYYKNVYNLKEVIKDKLSDNVK